MVMIFPLKFHLHVLLSLVEASNLVAVLMLLVEESEGSSLLGFSHSLVHRVCKWQLLIHLSQSNLVVVCSGDEVVILRDVVRRDHVSGVFVIPSCRYHHSRILDLHANHFRVLVNHVWRINHFRLHSNLNCILSFPFSLLLFLLLSFLLSLLLNNPWSLLTFLPFLP